MDGCREKHHANNYCRLHNQRWRRKGDPLDSGRTVGLSTEERFFRSCERRGDNECWPWILRRTKDGYGSFWDGTKRNGHNYQQGAHRWAYKNWIGQIPEGMEVCHSCDNPPCVNPKHLYADTHHNNASRAWKLGRQIFRKGELNGRAKITERDVIDIRRRRRKGESLVDLAREYDLNPVTVGSIVSGKLWKHVAIPEASPDK